MRSTFLVEKSMGYRVALEVIQPNGADHLDRVRILDAAIIIGRGGDDAGAQAIKLGISILSEEQLIASQLFHLGEFSRSKQ